MRPLTLSLVETDTPNEVNKGPERIWINESPESGRVAAYISPIREIGTWKSLSFAEYVRTDLAICTPEERAVLNAIIAEEEAKEIAGQAVHDEITPDGEAKVQALGQCVAERIQAIRALMAVRAEK